MESSSDLKPTVLILGGLQDGHSRALLSFIIKSTTDPSLRLARHIRLVDKYLCLPEEDAYTTYMDQECQKILKAGRSIGVEYLQANLLVASSRLKVFMLPEEYQDPDNTRKSYDYVFDFTGETDYNLEEEVHIERTAKLLPELAKLAVEFGILAYVRESSSLYHSIDVKKPLVEFDGKPFSLRSKWIHEGIRAMAALPNLNLVIARPALLYGPYAIDGYASRLLIGEIYKYIGETMEHLWSAELRLHTIHCEDFARGLWCLARWMSITGRERSESVSDVIPCHLSISESIPNGLPSRDLIIRAPCFNLVDDGDTTQGLMASIAEKVVGVKVGFYGKVINQFAKLNMIDLVDDVNEKHCEPWPEMLARSNPPINYTPFTPSLPESLLSKHHIALDGSKIKRELNKIEEEEGKVKEEENIRFELKYPKMNIEIIEDQISKFKDEGIWPSALPKNSKHSKNSSGFNKFK